MRIFQIQVTFKLKKKFGEFQLFIFPDLKFRNIALSINRFEPGNILRLNIKNVGM